jgi:hypothetical protein
VIIQAGAHNYQETTLYYSLINDDTNNKERPSRKQEGQKNVGVV